ncbi:sugar transferase, partial [Streptomyces sp. NRRL WC-3549]|uniref:sugar transferase n=1 Tax=Streptomyces sp. NRRL WC-3549 TaxID=1463925 RepID=UPI0009EC32AB
MGLAGAPRPRSPAAHRRTPALEQPWRAPDSPRDTPRPRPAAGGPDRRTALLALTDLTGMGVPAWWVLHTAGAPRPWATAALAALVWVAVRAARGRYAERLPARPGALSPSLGDWLVLVGTLVVLLAVTARRPDPVTALPALVPGLAVALVTVAVARWRAAGRGGPARRVLVVGETAGLDRAVGRLTSRTGHPYAVVAAVPVGGDDVSTVLGSAFAHDADLVLVAPGPALTDDRLRRLSWGLHDGGIALCVLSDLSGTAAARVRPVSVAGLTLLHVAPPLRHGPQAALKTLVDRAGAALGLLVLAPLFLAVALAVRLTSRGPVFHRQVRRGLHNTPFTLWKFRTMVADAERCRERLAPANESEGPMFKMRRDPRVTRIGHTLRRTSVDELPQLLNVLRGDMSLVGPRPPLPDEVEHYDERELRRLAVRPGMTGLWQVSGRSDLSWQETVRLDLWYVDNWSVATDMGLLARTVRAVADGRGAVSYTH